MRLTIFLLTVALLQVSAKGLSQNVSFSGKDVPLEKVFAEIKKQTGFVFFYDLEVVRKSAPLTLDVKNIPLENFLKLAFQGQSLKYIIQGNSVVVFSGEPVNPNPVTTESLSPVPVRGKITDPNGNPLSGATLMIRGSGNLTVTATDENGHFDMNIEPGTVVEVSYVGFKTFKFTVSSQTKSYDIILSQSSASMNEVTVSTGYQIIAKERSTGAFTKVQGDEIQQKSVSINVVDRLEGQVPGLAVNYGVGNDKFLIRGVNSVNANRAPLYVLDGVPITYDDITRLVNPNDVDNIVVLRDAMATSIWGAQAANGVVVITTKKGKTIGKIKVQYNGFVSFKGLPDYGYQKMMSPQQFINTAKEIFDPTVFPYSYVSTVNPSFQLPMVTPHEQILYDENSGLISPGLANQRLDSLASLNNRSQIENNILQPSMLSNHSVSFTGGNPFYGFYGSLNYTNQKNTDRSDVNNYMINFRQNFNFTPFLKLDITTNLSQQNSKQFIIPNLPVLNTYLPYAMFKNDAGNNISQSWIQLYDPYRLNAEQQSNLNLDWVPLNESAYTGNNANNTLTARINAGLTINFLKKFTFEGRYQYESGNNNNYIYYDQNSYQTKRELVNFTQPGPVYNLPSQGGNYYTGSGTAISWAVRNQLTFNDSWTNSQLTVLAGTEINDRTITNSNKLIRGYDYQTMTYTAYNEQMLQNGMVDPVIPNFYDISLLSGPTYTGTETEIRYFSLYGNMAYAFKKRYNLNASIRMDQSNLFGTDVSQQYKPIWSVGSSWLISSEPFFHSGLVNNLKLRLTYGIGGNSPNPGSGGPYNIIYPVQSSFYNNVGLGYYVVRPANNKLTWESTATLNAGVDVSILNNRLSFALDVYDKKTSNLLGNVPFDPTNGWVNGYTNLGDITNKGVEFSIQSVNITNGNFSWNTIFNFGYNHNMVVRLGPVVPLDAYGKLNSTGFVEGYSAYSLFALKWAGLDNEGNPQIYDSKGGKIKMLNDLTLDDVHYAGTAQPVVYGGMTNTFRYKAFDLSFLIVYNFGDVMRSNINQYYSGRLVNNVSQYFSDRWKKPGDENITNIPSYIADPALSAASRTTDFYAMSDINVESAAYMKLRDLTLGYNLPVSWISKLSMEGVRIYAQVNNIMLWAANDQGVDPEYYNLMGGAGTQQNAGTGSSLGGAPRLGMPDRMKAFYTFGLNVSFK